MTTRTTEDSMTLDTNMDLDDYEICAEGIDPLPLHGEPTRELVERSAETDDGKVWAEKRDGVWHYVRPGDVDENSRIVWVQRY
jgi:hypothetical protein